MALVEPTLTGRAFLPLMSGMRGLGHDPAAFLRELGIAPSALNDPDARFPMSLGVRFLAKAEAVTGDEDIGLHLAEHADLRSVDTHYFAMSASATLEDAFARLSRYQRLIHESSRIEFAADRQGGVVRHVLPGGLAAPRHSAEFLVASWLRVGRLITASNWAPAEVRFAHARPRHLGEHRRLLGTRVRFGAGENSLRMTRGTLDLPCIGADAALASLLDRHVAQELRREGQLESTSVADRTRAVIDERLRDGPPTVASVAACLRMSVRTLSRALAAEGTSFRQLLDQLRHERAVRLLARQNMSIGEVAFVLGFSDISAFHRAFKRWSGQTPVEFRRR